MVLNLKRCVGLVGAGILVLTAAVVDAGRGGQWGPPVAEQSCDQVLDDAFEALPVSQLDESTNNDILLLREEEKMARDIYLTMSLLYDIPVFSNIARSEQHHMDLVEKLIDRYGLEDPAADTAIGVFEDEWVQSTFDDLIAIGNRSLIDALWVGATVEDVDIYHLDHILEHCGDNLFFDVSLIVQNMNAGSRNHMRSFAGALEKRGVIYQRQYISQERLDEILDSEMETAVILDEFGDVIAECGLAGGSRR